jgi:hypothetical protein
MTATRWGKAAALLALGAALVAGHGPGGRAQRRDELRDFMRQKLKLAQAVLEGLTREEYRTIAASAKGLRELSEDARWRVSPDINYLRLSREFQALAGSLEANAKERDLDGATLAYVRMAMNCVDCHKLVRDERLISLGRRGPAPGG